MTPQLPVLSDEEAGPVCDALGIPRSVLRLNIFRILCNHPSLFKGLFELGAVFLTFGGLPVRLRELVIMRVAWRSGSAYEWAQHWRLGHKADVPAADLAAVRDGPDHAGFDDAERAALAATDELFDDGALGPDGWARCEALLGGPEAVAELVMLVGHYRMVAGFLRSVDVPLEDGVTPWAPDGRAPG